MFGDVVSVDCRGSNNIVLVLLLHEQWLNNIVAKVTALNRFQVLSLN